MADENKEGFKQLNPENIAFKAHQYAREQFGGNSEIIVVNQTRYVVGKAFEAGAKWAEAQSKLLNQPEQQ